MEGVAENEQRKIISLVYEKEPVRESIKDYISLILTKKHLHIAKEI